MKVLCSQEVTSSHLYGVVPCQITAKASAPQGPWCSLSVWLQQGVPEDRAWSKPIDFYALSCSSFRKKARNLIETAQRKSQQYATEDKDGSSGVGQHQAMQEGKPGWALKECKGIRLRRDS
jgi:hypothetical protein